VHCANIDWTQLLSGCCDANELWSCFTSVLAEGINLFVPVLRNRNFVGKRFTFSKVERKLYLKKKTLWKKFKCSKSEKCGQKYKEAAKSLKSALKNKELAAEKQIILSNDTNRLHKYLKSANSQNAGVAPLKNNAGFILTSPLDVANEFNESFVSVGTLDDGTLHVTDKPTLLTDALNLVYFGELETYNSCRKLKSKFSVGPDGIPSVVYRELATCLAEPLAMIFCLIMQFGSLPDIWKSAIVIPLYKKGSASNAKNYRPISLTCIGCKLFESTIKSNLQAHLEAN